MKIIIDADACPVVDIAVDIAKERNLECILVCDNTHLIQKDGAETIIVDKGVDSADCKIANLTEKGDVIITQDYGLAALVLGKGGKALNQNGLIYSDTKSKICFSPVLSARKSVWQATEQKDRKRERHRMMRIS